MIKDLDVQGVGGLTMGADPVSCAVSFSSFINKKDIASFSIRKERKGHGMKKLVEGDVKKGDRVVIVEDVITTGGSTIKAIEAARNEDPDYFGNHWGIARVNFELGEFKAAVESLRRALNTPNLQPPASDEIPALLAECMTRLEE